MMRIIVSFVLLLAATSVVAQHSNSCAYPFALKSGKNTFNFCLTDTGTLAQLGNVLDPVNPIEGLIVQWLWGNAYYNVPGLGLIDGFSGVVSQPHGPGTLPITFAYNLAPSPLYSTVNASALAKTVTFSMRMKDPWCYCDDDGFYWWEGWVYRVLTLSTTPGPSNFDSLASSIVGYNHNVDGILVRDNPFVLDAPDLQSVDWRNVGGIPLPFVGQGTIVAASHIYGGGTWQFSVTYQYLK